MPPSLTETLCTTCGLCCDGTLFADVELAGSREVTRLEILGLEVEDEGGGTLLVLPCTALQGRRCSIYPHRPSCCRTFECKLLQDTRRGTVSVEQASRHIADVHQRIGRLETLLAQFSIGDTRLPLSERCAEVLSHDAGGARSRLHAELDAAMSAVEGLIRKTFLGGLRKG